MKDLPRLEQTSFNGDEFPSEVLDWIGHKNLWNIWVPKSFRGLEMLLPDGLKMLQSLAKFNGSLGWTVTLCSGANFFVGNLKNDVAEQIFNKSRDSICFGGSGGATGTAQINGDNYVLNGTWRYATGAPYLTHFTLNAKIQKDGVDIVQEDGSPLIRSFIVDKQAVEIVKDWNTMGLRATATHSFRVNSKQVDGKYSFKYDELHLPQPIFKIPFVIFADLTLWVNYIGMAEHFLEESQKIIAPNHLLHGLQQAILIANKTCHEHATHIQNMIMNFKKVPEAYSREIHQKATDSVQLLYDKLIKVYPILGIRACTVGHPLNQIFSDFFTATQHHNFSPLSTVNNKYVIP